MKKNIAIITGGDSSEYEISLQSAQQIYDIIDKELYDTFIVSVVKDNWAALVDNKEIPVDRNDFSFSLHNNKINFDCAYISIHGKPGENGILQGYFDLIGMPYTSCNLFVSAITFNKFSCKSYLQKFGIEMANAVLVRKNQEINPESIIQEVGLPCFVKPNNGGSSFGISKVNAKNDLLQAISKAMAEDDEVIIEAFIKGREISCGVLKTKMKNFPLPITEIITQNEFFDYEAKYTSGLTEEITPADMPSEIIEKVNILTSEIYDKLGCSGIVRIDFIVKGNIPYFLEINTVPGMSEESIIPKQLRANGYKITDVFSNIIEDAIAGSK